MYVVGLTGPIASGKTTLANFLKKKGAMVIDADSIGHDLLLESNIKDQIKETFGSEAFENDQISRQRLAKIVFSSKQQLVKLNKVLWPPIIDTISKELQLDSRTLPANEIVIIDAPFLREAGLDQDTDIIVAIVSGHQKQIERLKNKGFSEKEALARIEMQTPKNELIDASDYIIKNDSSLKDLKKEAEKLWHFIKK